MTFDKHLLDSNILIDYLNGIVGARDLIDSVPSPMISVITRMELLAGARNDAEEVIITKFLDRFETVHLEQDVITEATRLRRHGIEVGKKLKLPDAIIKATATVRSAVLYTRNFRDFPASETVVIPSYELPTPPPKTPKAKPEAKAKAKDPGLKAA